MLLEKPFVDPLQCQALPPALSMFHADSNQTPVQQAVVVQPALTSEQLSEASFFFQLVFPAKKKDGQTVPSLETPGYCPLLTAKTPWVRSGWGFPTLTLPCETSICQGRRLLLVSNPTDVTAASWEEKPVLLQG